MRVVVAEDSLFTREGIVHLLASAGVEVVGQAGDGEELARQVVQLMPDVAIIDVRMPPTHTTEGIATARVILATQPTVGVLVLSQYLEPGFATELLDERPDGVGYLLKDRVFDIAVLVDALRRITERESVIDPSIVKRLLERKNAPGSLAALPQREREVLGLVAEGLSNRAIAERLFITERTVEAHITRVFTRLGIVEDPTVHRRVLATLAYLRRASP